MKKNSGVLLLATLAVAFSACVGVAAVGALQNHEPEVVKAAEGDYWSGVNLTGATYGSALRDALCSVMIKKGTATGSNSYKALNTILKSSDAMPSGSGVCAFYRQDSVSTGWNKEHVWPNSRGAGENAGYAGTDPQVIRPTNTSDNSSRSNYMYGETTSPSQSNGWDPNSFGFDGARGEAARIIFYAAVRYKDKANGAGGSYKGSASGLELTENLNDATTNATMGKLSTLMTWNTKYAVTRAETYRNEYLVGQNYARNPFIDHPELAGYIWDGSGTGAYGGTSSNKYIRTVAPTASTSPAVTVASSTASVNKGSSTTVQATAKNFDGTVTWSVASSASTIATATVSSNGLVTISGVKGGSATITVSASYGGTTKSATIAVTVASTDPILILGSPSISTTLNSTGNTTITASNFSGTVSYSYSYSTSGIATVSISSGTLTVTPTAVGTTTVTISGSDGTNSASTSLSVTVTAAVSTATITGSHFKSSSITSYETTETSHTLNNISVSTLYCATFDSGSTIQFKKSQKAHIASTAAVNNLSTITLDVSNGTFTVYGSTDGSSWTEISGSSNVYSLSGYTYWKVENDTSSSAVLNSLTIAYGSATTKTLSSISLAGPTKTTYNVGDSFSTSGLVVTAHYSDSTTATVTPTSVSPVNGATLSASDTTCTVTYTEGGVTKTATVALTINSSVATVSSIAVTTNPTKVSYTVGDTFSSTGLVITATYSDGTSAAVTGYTLSSPDMSTAGTKTVTVTYSGKTATFSIVVNAASGSSTTYTLITSTDQLVSGSKYIIASKAATSGCAMSSTQNSNNRGKEDVTISSDLKITATDTIEQLTLGGDATNGWSFYANQSTTKGYLYAASSSNNYLRTQTTNDSNGLWTITISSNAATITAKGSNTRKILKWNSSSSVFSCYASGQAAVYLYKQDSTGSSDLTLAKQWAQTFNAAFSNICNAQGNTAIATIQSTWATQYSNYGNLASAVQAYLTAATSTDSDITTMWAKYTYIYGKYGTNLTSGAYGGDYLNKASGAYKGDVVASSSDSTAILVVATMLAAGLVGFYFLRKRKAI